MPESIPPGLDQYRPKGGWQSVDYTRIARHSLVPGVVIKNIPHLRDFSRIEENVCVEMEPDMPLFQSMGQAIATNRLGIAISPRHFNGNVTNCHALLFPFDIKRVEGYPNSHLRNNYNKTTIFEGLIMLAVADLHTRGHDYFLAREIAYHRMTQRSNRLNHGAIRRNLGWSEYHDPTNKAIAIDYTTSQAVATLVTRHALGNIIYMARGNQRRK